ncbi:hypothetical protein ACQPX6_01915 [Actinomycetospora sp. CA-101289]
MQERRLVGDGEAHGVGDVDRPDRTPRPLEAVLDQILDPLLVRTGSSRA